MNHTEYNTDQIGLANRYIKSQHAHTPNTHTDKRTADPTNRTDWRRLTHTYPLRLRVNTGTEQGGVQPHLNRSHDTTGENVRRNPYESQCEERTRWSIKPVRRREIKHGKMVWMGWAFDSQAGYPGEGTSSQESVGPSGESSIGGSGVTRAPSEPNHRSKRRRAHIAEWSVHRKWGTGVQHRQSNRRRKRKPGGSHYDTDNQTAKWGRKTAARAKREGVRSRKTGHRRKKTNNAENNSRKMRGKPPPEDKGGPQLPWPHKKATIRRDNKEETTNRGERDEHGRSETTKYACPYKGCTWQCPADGRPRWGENMGYTDIFITSTVTLGTACNEHTKFSGASETSKRMEKKKRIWETKRQRKQNQVKAK